MSEFKNEQTTHTIPLGKMKNKCKGLIMTRSSKRSQKTIKFKGEETSWITGQKITWQTLKESSTSGKMWNTLYWHKNLKHRAEKWRKSHRTTRLFSINIIFVWIVRCTAKSVKQKIWWVSITKPNHSQTLY